MTVSIHNDKPVRLSYSQLGSYGECPRKWYLSRRERVPERTWFATIGGKALHQATEEQDRLEWAGLGLDIEGAKERFQELFTEGLLEAKLAGEEVKASGRKLKELGWSGGPEKKDEAWWRHFAPFMIDRWFAWRSANGMRLHEINGLPAIEVEVGFDLLDSDGVALTIKGFIDRVYASRIGGILTVVDLKTGAVPTTQVQLETYGLGLEVAYGHKARYGAFWGPGADKDEDNVGRVHGPYELHRDAAILSDIYHAARRGIEAEAFPPNTRNNCASCGVNQYCTAWSGSKAVTELEKWREQLAASDSGADVSVPRDGEDPNNDSQP